MTLDRRVTVTEEPQVELIRFHGHPPTTNEIGLDDKDVSSHVTTLARWWCLLATAAAM